MGHKRQVEILIILIYPRLLFNSHSSKTRLVIQFLSGIWDRIKANEKKASNKNVTRDINRLLIG